MFTHIINNTNNFKINFNDYYIIPFGHRCTSAHLFKRIKLYTFV